MEKKKYVKAYDTLKGLAVLITVTIGHYWQFTPAGYYADGSNVKWVEFTNKITQLAFSKSHSLMELLLMISGFQLFAYYERINSDKISFGEYFKKRAARLIPIAAISSIIMYIGAALYVNTFNEYWCNTVPSPANLLENIFLIQSWVNNYHSLNGPLWYVSVYFFCTLLFYFLARINKRHGGLFFMALPIVLGIGLMNAGSTKVLMNGDMCRGYIAFFMGVLVAYFCEKMSKKQVACISITALVSFTLIYSSLGAYVYSGEVHNKVLLALVLLYAPILMIVTRFPLIDMIIGNPGISWLGKVSYELCALNFPFYLWVEFFNRKYKWNIPYGKVPAYYIQLIIQVLLAVAIHYGVIGIKYLISKRKRA